MWTVLTVSLGGSRLAQGQSRDTMRVVLPEIEVGAMHNSTPILAAPYAVSMKVLSGDMLSSQTGQSLQGVLQGLPGVWITERGHYALGERVIIRGMGWRSAFGVRGIQVLLDGIPLTLPDGQGMLDIVDPAFIRQAEVMRGPSSTFWGNGSGGVLVLSTTEFRDSSYVGVKAMGGSYGLKRTSIEAAAPLGRHRVQGFLSHVENDGYRDYSTGSFVRSGLNGLFDFGPKTQLRFMAAMAIQDTESPGALTASQRTERPRGADIRNVNAAAGKESTQFQVGATIYRETSLGLLSATAYSIIRQLDNPLSFAYIDLNRSVRGGRVQLENTGATWSWGIGMDGGFQDDRRLNLNNVAGLPGTVLEVDQRETVRNLSAFAQGRRQLWSRLVASVGLRADMVRFELKDRIPGNELLSGNRQFSAYSPSVGLVLLTNHGQLFANASTAFETPTTTELVNQPDGTSGLNAEVDAQKTRGIEIGFRGEKGLLTYDLAVFAMRTNDRLLPFQDSEGRTYYQNEGSNTHKGVEIALQRSMGQHTNIQLAYTNSGFEFDDGGLKGNRIPGIPVHHLFVGLNTFHRGFSGQVSADTVSDMFANDENTATSAGYVVVDMSAGYGSLRLGSAHVKPFAKISNIFGAEYVGSLVINAFGGRYYEPSPGRTFQMGVSVDF